MKTPIAIWTESILKTGTAILDSMQAVVSRPGRPEVAVIPTADAPPAAKAQPSVPREAPRARRKPPHKAKRKAKGKRRAKR